MADEGPTTVGSINATLKLNADQFEAKIKEAAAQADALDGRDIKTKVTVESSSGGAGAVASDLEKVVQAEGKAKASTDALAKARRDMEVADNNWRIATLNLEKVEGDANATEQQLLAARNRLITASSQAEKAETAMAAAVKAAADAERGEADATDRSTKAKKANADAGKAQFSAMQGIAAAAPLLIGATDTLAAATVALGMGFTAMGAAGIAAVIGIKAEMASGTQVGDQYSAGLNTLQDDLDSLGHTAAVGLLQSFNTAVGDINQSMPSLNLLVSEGATYLGQMGGSVLSAVLSGLQQMDPLIRAGAADLSQFVGWLMSGVQSGGFQQFIGYAVANLPSVMTLLENLVTAAGHVLAAFAPMGPVVIGVLNGIADILNSFPLPVLAGIVTLFTTAAPAINLTKMAITGLGPLLQAAGEGATLFGMSLDMAVPVVGWVAAGITGLIALFTALAPAQQQATANANDYASALEQDNNQIGANTDKAIAQKAATEGVFDAAKKLGLSQQDLMGYMQGSATATQHVNSVLDASKQKTMDALAASTAYGGGIATLTADQQAQSDATQKVSDFLTKNKAAIEAAAKANRESATATESATAAQAEQAQAIQNLATQYGVTTTAIQNAVKANGDATDASGLQAAALQALAQKYGDTVPSIMALIQSQQDTQGTVDATTLKLQEQNDAAGLLKQALDGLNGKALSAADAQNAFDSQLANMGTHVTAAGKQIHFTTNNIGNMSAASVALRGQLNSQVTDLENVAEAYRNNGHSAEDTRKKMEGMRQQIIDNAVAHGVDRDAVTQYIDKILQIPASVPPTKVEIDDAAAKAELAVLQVAIDRLHGTTITNTVINDQITNNQSVSAQGTHVGNNGSIAAYAYGGHVGYLASGGSDPLARGTDTVRAMLTPGEFVVPRASAQALNRDSPGALEYIRSHGTLPPGQSSQPVLVQPVVQVYVGGEQLDARTIRVVQDQIGRAARDAAAMRLGV